MLNFATMKGFTLTILLAFLWLTATGSTVYSTVHNHFRTLAAPASATIDKQGRLVLDNNNENPIFVSDTILINTASPFKFYTRAINLHSGNKKSYKVVTAAGGTMRVSHPAWGVFLQCGEDLYTIIVNTEDDSWSDEVRSSHTARVIITHLHNGIQVNTVETTIERSDDWNETLHALGLQVNEGELNVLMGKERLEKVQSMKLSTLNGEATVGIIAGAGSKPAIERAVLTYNNESSPHPIVTWTREELDEHFASSRDPYEGYWQYLDRELEDKWLALGGRYTIALVANGNGYDILYIAGAQVMGSKWQECRQKGTMISTIFNENYQATWIDATGNDMGPDVQATFESGSILTVKFPVFKSQLRFSRIR